LPRLEVKNLSRSFGSLAVVDKISFKISSGQVTCLLGPSGCGKSTTLRMIAGVETPSSGQIFVDDELISSASFQVPPEARSIGLMFQDFALFPHLNVQQNVYFGLAGSKEFKQKRSFDLLEKVGLAHFAFHYPHSLSGGEQQRIALARAIATSPNLLLLDEPLSALDAKVRVHLRQELKNFHRRLGLTTVMVTHDQEEALSIADRIFVMDSGKIMQSGTPEDIYANSSNPFVANFIGMTNFIEGQVLNKDSIKVDNQQIA